LKTFAGTDSERAQLLLEKAEHTCLIANSLRAARTLEVRITEQ
jgi:organic hydroperoxide reductase OsmC/OhrA